MDKNLIYPEPAPIGPDEAESPDNWGFADTRFSINDGGHVTILGTRYELSGKELVRLLPWIRETLGVDLDVDDVHRSNYPTRIPESLEAPEFIKDISGFLKDSQLDFDGENRLRHGHGHTQEEMFAIKHKQLGRIPDLVVYPEMEEQIAGLIEAAKKHDV